MGFGLWKFPKQLERQLCVEDFLGGGGEVFVEVLGKLDD